MATFSVVVPTSGRATLANALASIGPQLRPGDELLVACNADGDYGDAARNRMIERAAGSHLVFLDDDDEWVTGALDRMRRFADEHPGRVGIFRMRYDLHGVWPPEPGDLLRTATGLYVVPNVAGRVGRFRADPVHGPHFDDYAFISETLRLQGSEPVWVDEVTVLVRPERRWWVRLRWRLRLRSRLRRLVSSALRRSIRPAGR